jgi:hypothetical protein
VAGLAVATVAVVAIAGVMSGLTLGLLSLDRLDLEVMLRTGALPADTTQPIAHHLCIFSLPWPWPPYNRCSPGCHQTRLYSFII